MGCWNKTCGLSNLPIFAGEQTYVFVLEKSSKGSSDRHCYSTHLYHPLLVPFVSTYNDYGAGENSTGIGFELAMASLKKNLIEMPLGENPFHDIAVTRAAFDEDSFFQSVSEGRLFVTGWDGDRQIEYVMFRKDVVDTVLDNHVITEWVGEGKGTTGYKNCYVTYKFADIVREIPATVALIKERHNHREMPAFGGPPDAIRDTRIGKWMSYKDTYRYSSIIRVWEVVSDYINAGDTVAIELLLTEFLRGCFVDSFMESTRKSWIPQCGEGSQAEDFSAYRTLNAAMEKIMTERDLEMSAFADDDEEEWNNEEGAN